MATYLNKILPFLLLPTLLMANEKALETIYEQVLITYSTIDITGLPVTLTEEKTIDTELYGE